MRDARYRWLDSEARCYKILFVLLTSAVLLCSNHISAQAVKISASIDSNHIIIGDQIQLKLSATYNPQKFRVNFPNVPDTFNHFEIVEKGKVDTAFGRDENTFKQIIKITNFDSGQWKIPSFVFDIQSLQGGEPETQLSDSFLVNVNTVSVDTTQPFKPIFGIRSAKMPLKQIIMYVLAGILIAILLGFLIWYIRKKMKENKKQEIKAPEIILLPHEKALQQLAQIEKRELWQNNQEKIYHTEVTDVARTYLEEQFKLDCLEKTSSEIIQQVKKIKALSTSRQALRTIFETADMVKFAKGKPTPEEHMQSLELTKEFILESYKKVKPLDTTTTTTQLN